MKVLKAKEIKNFEQESMKSFNIEESDLMLTAGYQLVKDFLNRVKPSTDELITVIAGTGNNGGDALVMYIELKKIGYKTNLFVIGDVSSAKDAFLKYFDLAGQVEIANSLEEVNSIQDSIYDSDYVIDGLFGIGLSKPIKGYRKELIEYINASSSNVYSIDIPSGLNPDNGLIMDVAIKANYTGVIGFYKLGNLLNNAMDYHGETKLLDIGIKETFDINRNLIRLEDFDLILPKRLHASNKYTYGLGVFIGGQQSMMGSIQLAAMAGMKSGLGITRIITNLNNNCFTQFYPELIIQDNIGIDLMTIINKAKSVVYGPGIEELYNHKLLLEEILKTDIPIIIDASGLEHIELKEYPNKNIILTPHLGELSKLINVEKSLIENEPLKYLKILTDKGFNVLLKGSANILATKEETVIIPVYNTGLATAGSGDVLSGIIAGSIDKDSILESMIKAVYIHSKSADFAKEETGEISLVSSDIIKNIHKVLRSK